MSARRTDMHRVQEAIRLHRMGRSRRQVARQLRMGRDTIRTYLEAVAEAGLLEGSPDELPDAKVLGDLVRQRFARTPPKQQTSSVARWEATITKLLDKGATPTPIHDHLRLHEPDYTGSLSAVKRMCARLKKDNDEPDASKVAIPVDTDPGEIAQVDFGYAGKRYDPTRGEMRRCWLFVMSLAHSRHMFVSLVFDQKVATWIDLHIEAFEFFGGVPKVIVPDNLKAAVIRAAFGVDDDAALHRSYRELARHYGFQIDPTPPYSPEKKGKVERNVRFVRNSFLNTWTSVDIREDRRQLLRWNLEIAAKRRHGTTRFVPIERFEDCERDELLPLPRGAWEPIVWKKARVHRDCHVQVEGAFYSAPWKLVKQDLWVRCTAKNVTLYHAHEHIWTHDKIARGQRRTVELHLPDHRRDLRHRSTSYWNERAGNMGPEVRRLAETIFGADEVLLNLRRVQAVVTHLEKFPKDRACRTAARALHFGNLDYGGIKNILTRCLDLEPLPNTVSRSWAKGARFARRPATEVLSFMKEKRHVHLERTDSRPQEAEAVGRPSDPRPANEGGGR